MDDLRRLLLLRLLVVSGPCVMLLWLRFGLTPSQPLPLWAVGMFLALMALGGRLLGRGGGREQGHGFPRRHSLGAAGKLSNQEAIHRGQVSPRFTHRISGTPTQFRIHAR